MLKKRILALAIATLMIPSTFLMGCGNSKEAASKENNNNKPAQETKIKDQIVYALWSSPTGVFNPLLTDTTYDDAVIALTYSSLLKSDENSNLVGDLAENYKISDDKLSVTFKLKDNIKWHDGQPLTANDVAFTFTSIANKDYQGSRFGDVEKLKGATEYHEGKADKVVGIEVIDDQTIKFDFTEPYAPGLTAIGGMGIIPKHIWESVPIAQWKEKTDLLSKAVGSGPYKLVSFEPGQEAKLERFDDFYGDKAKTKNFIFKVSNQDTAQAELSNGTIDVADVSTLKKQDIDDLKNDNLNISTFPNRMFQYMGFNLREPKFQDVKVRQAFMYGIDRKLMVDKLLEGNGVVLNAPILPTSWAYPDAKELNSYDYNVDKAKELLKEAGYEDRDGDGVVENSNGEKLEATLTYPTGNKTREQTAPIIKEDLKKIGVQINLESMEFSTLMDKVVANHNFDLYLMGNNLALDPDPKPYWYSTAATNEKGVSGWNIAYYINKDADKLIDEGLATYDQAERKKIYAKFAKLMNKDVPWVYLYDQNVTMASNHNLKNYKPDTFNQFNDVENWYIEEN